MDVMHSLMLNGLGECVYTINFGQETLLPIMTLHLHLPPLPLLLFYNGTDFLRTTTPRFKRGCVDKRFVTFRGRWNRKAASR